MKPPVAIDVDRVDKGFRVQSHPRSAPRGARGRGPSGGRRGRELPVLRDISFEVHRGEFFGIVGRNGSGKSTLLKLLASIYRPDRGRIRIAGRLAPFLELGVGFNPQLAAYDNVVLNGVMMGLSAREARRRYAEIVDFAGLREHTDLKLKNYSSGMKVRLGFAVMTHVEADVLLIDEVLAVGDAEFQEKCGDVFRTMHDEGRTIVLVTHSMEAIVTYCERAMLIDGGTIGALGDPQDVANRYFEVNMRAAMGRPDSAPPMVTRIASVLADPLARVDDVWLEDPAGRRTESVDAGEPIEMRAVMRVEREMTGPGAFLRLNNQRGQTVFERPHEELAEDASTRIAAGERLSVTATIANRLAPGRYVLICGITETDSDGSPQPAGPTRSVSFEVYGEPDRGMVKLDVEVAAERTLDEEALRR
jgi:ABC-2 type transport system ATP-binding protein